MLRAIATMRRREEGTGGVSIEACIPGHHPSEPPHVARNRFARLLARGLLSPVEMADRGSGPDNERTDAPERGNDFIVERIGKFDIRGARPERQNRHSHRPRICQDRPWCRTRPEHGKRGCRHQPANDQPGPEAS